jgi:hypothetical protein
MNGNGMEVILFVFIKPHEKTLIEHIFPFSFWECPIPEDIQL